MNIEKCLKKAEQKLTPIYRFPIVKALWLVDALNSESDKTIYISVIVNDTHKDYKKNIKKIHIFLNKFDKSENPEYLFKIYTLSEYWNLLVSGDARLYSEIRLSMILYDPAGFFAPFKVLLLQGKIPCTRESAYRTIICAPEKIMHVHRNIKREVLSALYNLVIDAGQAPLVLKGFDPPIPKKLPDMLTSCFSRKELSEKDIELLKNVIVYYKDVEHGKINEISANNIHVFLEASEIFIKNMERLMNKLNS